MLEQIAVVVPSQEWEEGVRGRISSRISSEFPSIFVRAVSDREIEAVPHLTAAAWRRRDFDVWRFDRTVDDLAGGAFTLVVADDRGACGEFPLQVLNRCQRLIGRRNHHSHSHLFELILARHRAMHDLARPSVRADFDHALDVWQWVLRLDGGASMPLQVAALFHDVEHLVSEPAREEPMISIAARTRNSHSLLGAAIAQGVVVACGATGRVAARVGEIIAAHESFSDDPEVQLLNDADALSWFSLHSAASADRPDASHMAVEVESRWRRMSSRARLKLRVVHLRDDVAAVLRSIATREPEIVTGPRRFVQAAGH